MKTKTQAAVMPLSKLAQLQEENKIYLDDSFQSQERWDVLQKQDYMTSVFEGRAVTSIILADIKSIVSALRLAFGEDNEDYIFFVSLLNQGYKWITIDGNNRDRCIAAFLNDDFPLAEREYETDDQFLTYFKAKKDNKYYSKLPADAKNYVDSVPINVLIVSKCDRIGLAALFIAVNKGMNLNAQEKRNAIMCVFGNYVRNLVKKLDKGFLKIYTKNSLNRRYADDMVVTAAVIIAKGIDVVSGASRDAAYTDTSDELQVFTKRVEPIMTQIVDKMVVPYGAGAIKVGGFDSGNFIDLIMLLNYMRGNSIVIEDYKAFYNWFAESQSARVDCGDILYEGSRGTNKRTYAGLLRGTGKNFLTIRQNMLIESLGLVSDGILSFRDRERNFDPKLRYFFWKRQEGMCPLKNTKIEPRYIWDMKITHIDHNIPWSKEGETSEDNGQLTFADANLAKSNTMFTPVVREL